MQLSRELCIEQYVSNTVYTPLERAVKTKLSIFTVTRTESITQKLTPEQISEPPIDTQHVHLWGWLKTYTRWRLQTETGHEWETHTPRVVHSGKQTHTSCFTACVCVWPACGVCIPSAGAVESGLSSLAVAPAEVRGYMLRLAGENKTSHSTPSTTDGLH